MGLYVFTLVMALVMGSLDLIWYCGSAGILIFFLVSFLSTAIRLGPRLPAPFTILQNKYVMWTYLFLLVQHYLRPEDESESGSIELWMATGRACALTVAVAAYKSKYGYNTPSKHKTASDETETT